MTYQYVPPPPPHAYLPCARCDSLGGMLSKTSGARARCKCRATSKESTYETRLRKECASALGDNTEEVRSIRCPGCPGGGAWWCCRCLDSAAKNINEFERKNRATTRIAPQLIKEFLNVNWVSMAPGKPPPASALESNLLEYDEDKDVVKFKHRCPFCYTRDFSISRSTFSMPEDYKETTPATTHPKATVTLHDVPTVNMRT